MGRREGREGEIETGKLQEKRGVGERQKRGGGRVQGNIFLSKSVRFLLLFGARKCRLDRTYLYLEMLF